VVKVGRCGICGSDLHMTEDAAYGCQKGDVLGHEFAGEVVALGRNTQGPGVGDLVSVIPLKSCGSCEHCRKGEVQWCSAFGLQGGGYAEYAVTRPNQCIPLPTGLTLADGALIEPLAVALHGVNLSGMKTGDKVLVLGAGPIGLAVAFWAKRWAPAGWRCRTLPGLPAGTRRAHGGRCLRGRSRKPGCQCRAGPGRQGRRGVRMRRPARPDRAGRGTGPPARHDPAAGPVHPPDTFNSFAMLSKEVRLVTSAFFTVQEYEAALAALEQGAVAPRLMVTGTITLAETPGVYEALKQRTEQCKVMIAP
jgi:(R,R)-butanediol dehydrogenase / meso-butanediol dehydrogenase / diacetyl reductase